MGLEPHIMPIGTGDSSSSTRSIRSIQSNTTVKAISPPPPTTITASSSTAFPYTVGRLSTFHDTDTDMDDPFSMPTHVGHHRHRIDSQGVPIPPARTTSLGQHGHSNSVSSSDNSLPSVQVTTATPTKRSSKYTHNQHPYQGHGQGYDQHQYSNTFGHGSLDVTEDRGYSFPHYSSSTDQFTTYTSGEGDSDAEPELREMKLPEEEEDKIEKQRRQGRERQRRKRARDKQDKQNSQVQVQPAGFVGSTPTPTSTTANSRNPSTTSLAPIIVPNLNLNMNMNMNMSMTTMRSSASSSSVYSSLPTSASFPSTSPITQTHQSMSTSGTSSPTTFFSPMTPATNSGQDGYPWMTTPNRASKSAVDVRTTQLSRSNTGNNHQRRIVAPPPHRVPLASSSTSSHSAKRRRSEPEPEHFKTKQVGLGMNMPPQDQSQGQGPIEFLSTPTDESGSIKKERPGMRRTASDSAATALEFSHTHQSRSPTPPLLESLKSGYIPLDPVPHSQAQSQAGLLASVALNALVDNPSENVKRALAELKFTREGLLGLQNELSSFFGRFCLEKEMGAVTLEDRPNTSYPTTSGFTSSATTPYHENISLSTTSTRPPSPMRMDTIPTTATRPSTSKATPKTSRARSLSSVSMRARGLKMSSANTTANTHTHKSPGLSLYQETLISPMSTTPYQFPNTPVTAMPDSDEASASPMMSAVQTPTTGQSQAFPHHEILAIGQGTMRVDQGRPRHAEGEGGGGGYQHQRSATEGGGKGWNQAHSHGHAHGHGHARTGSNWELQQTNHRPNSAYPQNIPQSHSMPGLSSPLDMPYRQAPIAPPPHLPPPAFEFTYPQHQNHASTVHQNQQQTSFQTPSHRHHNSNSGLSTPFTPSPAQHHSHNHNHTGGAGVYQPTFTPIAEMGTPTRPSPREPRMLAYDPSSMGRMGEMDQMILSPPPQVQPSMMEGNWMAFGQVMPHTATGADGGGFGADPFGGNTQQR